MTLRERKVALRDSNADLARELVRSTGWSHPQVNAELNRLSGIRKISEATLEQLEQVQRELAETFAIDEETAFTIKKQLTSAFRRVAPLGLATTVGWSCNFRSLRHVIEVRTAPDAEEELRLVFGKVYETVKSRYPNLFSDYTVEMVEGLPWIKTVHRKV